MRSKLLAIVIGAVIILAAGAWSGAHAAGAQGSAGKYTGCLAKGDGSNEFKLTNVDGGSGEYELVGGKDLKDHVGHKVEVTGKTLSAKHAAKAEKRTVISNMIGKNAGTVIKFVGFPCTITG